MIGFYLPSESFTCIEATDYKAFAISDSSELHAHATRLFCVTHVLRFTPISDSIYCRCCIRLSLTASGTQNCLVPLICLDLWRSPSRTLTCSRIFIVSGAELHLYRIHQTNSSLHFSDMFTTYKGIILCVSVFRLIVRVV